VILSKAIMFIILEASYVVRWGDNYWSTEVDEYPHIRDVKLETCSNFVDAWRVEVGANSNNIKDVILDAMGICGSLTNFDMASKDLPWMWWWLWFQGMIWFRGITQTSEHVAL
jgi:hypothetical protein